MIGRNVRKANNICLYGYESGIDINANLNELGCNIWTNYNMKRIWAEHISIHKNR